MLKSRIPLIIAELPDKALDGVEDLADRVVEGAKARVHVSPGPGPHLRDAIHKETDRTSGEVRVVAGDEDVFWGHLEEHGTTHSAPHPFLTPAYEAERANLERIVGPHIKEIE